MNWEQYRNLTIFFYSVLVIGLMLIIVISTSMFERITTIILVILTIKMMLDSEIDLDF